MANGADVQAARERNQKTRDELRGLKQEQQVEAAETADEVRVKRLDAETAKMEAEIAALRGEEPAAPPPPPQGAVTVPDAPPDAPAAQVAEGDPTKSAKR